MASSREAFLARPGLTLVVTAGAEPLWPQGFDPLNVRVVSPSEVLHTRFVRLGNRSGSIEVVGDSALTVAAGAHPLFNGVRSITLTGLPGDFDIRVAGDTVAVDSGRVRAVLRGAAQIGRAYV